MIDNIVTMNLVLLLLVLVNCRAATAVASGDGDENAMLTDKIERLEAQTREQGAIIQNLTNLMNEFCQTFQLLQSDGAAVNNTGPMVHGKGIDGKHLNT